MSHPIAKVFDMLEIQFLIAPMVALMGLAFLLNMVLRKFHGSKYEQLATGSLFGCAIVLGMTNPIVIDDGLIFDTRTLLIGAATVFGGPAAGAVALLFGLSARVVIGGAGLLSGVIGLALAYAIAMAWRQYVQPRMTNRVLGDMTFGLVITSSIIGVFVLPYDIAISIVADILPVLLITDAIGMAAIGFIYRREVQYFIDAKLLEAYAKTDPLTATLNRRGLDRAFDDAFFDENLGHALLYFDIDSFKQINDTHGHDAGDKVLSEIAKRIQKNIREEAILARHGGDEFSIYIPGLQGADLQRVANRLCRLIADTPIRHNDTAIKATISMGGIWTSAASNLQDMIDGADMQLLQAKAEGKNRAVVAIEKPAQDAVAVA
ncbi:MAG: diguanylate cyclase [Pseudomonadota bacterium]